jgi:hypothetical protein
VQKCCINRMNYDNLDRQSSPARSPSQCPFRGLSQGVQHARPARLQSRAIRRLRYALFAASQNFNRSEFPNPVEGNGGRVAKISGVQDLTRRLVCRTPSSIFSLRKGNGWNGRTMIVCSRTVVGVLDPKRRSEVLGAHFRKSITSYRWYARRNPSCLGANQAAQVRDAWTPRQPRYARNSTSARKPYKRIRTSRAVAGAKGRSNGR